MKKTMAEVEEMLPREYVDLLIFNVKIKLSNETSKACSKVNSPPLVIDDKNNN